MKHISIRRWHTFSRLPAEGSSGHVRQQTSGARNFFLTRSCSNLASLGSISVVHKFCSAPTESPFCVPQVCVSCCDEMYCNLSVPSNQSTAVYSDSRTKARRRAHQHNSTNSTNTASRHRPPPSSPQGPAHLLIAVVMIAATLMGI